MNNRNETTTIESIGSDIVFQQDKAQIDIQIATAKAYPRNITRSTDNAITIVTMSKKTASTCNYSLPRGGKNITGPSVHLAKIIAQCWGNLRIESKVVDIGRTQITSQAIAFDLETNLAIKVEVKRSIASKNGVRYKDDMITVTGNASNAIALRNAVFAVVPRGVVDAVYEASKKKITGDLSDKEKLIQERTRVFNGFKDNYGVTEDEVLKAIGKPSIATVNADDMVTLIGIAQAILDGDTTVDLAFRSNPSADQKKEEMRKKGDTNKDDLP